MWTSLRLAHQPACTCYQQPSFKKTMQKIHITLLTVLSSVFFSAGAIAQNKPLACQGDAAAGLNWENGKWVARAFNEPKFILVQTKDGLTTESVAKVLSGTSRVSCTKVAGLIFCSEQLGASLFFNPATLKGGRASLFGAGQADNDPPKDTVTVTAFSCTPF